MTATHYILPEYPKSISSGKISWQSPSNIALVKYWGKYGEQLPKNASISFTLENCHTQTTLIFEEKGNSGFQFEVFLNGKREPDFEPKIGIFFERIHLYLPFLSSYKFRIETQNSFPHSSGIASSASGMSALSLCLMEMEKQFYPEMTDVFFKEKASFLARLGSGSACRSIEGPVVVWGEHPEIKNSSNLIGTKYPYEIHHVFKNYQDTILLVDKGEKQVSSTIGHNLMHNHPFSEQRFRQAQENLFRMIPVLKNGDLETFIQIVESESLSLHAMMLTSQPYFILMKPNTLEIINKIWNFRQETGSHVCFTLDAGANVHLLYPQHEKEKILTFIHSELAVYCKDGAFITDQTGFGAKRTSTN